MVKPIIVELPYGGKNYRVYVTQKPGNRSQVYTLSKPFTRNGKTISFERRVDPDGELAAVLRRRAQEIAACQCYGANTPELENRCACQEVA